MFAAFQIVKLAMMSLENHVILSIPIFLIRAQRGFILMENFALIAQLSASLVISSPTIVQNVIKIVQNMVGFILMGEFAWTAANQDITYLNQQINYVRSVILNALLAVMVVGLIVKAAIM
jgi:hypothetical protein